MLSPGVVFDINPAPIPLEVACSYGHCNVVRWLHNQYGYHNHYGYDLNRYLKHGFGGSRGDEQSSAFKVFHYNVFHRTSEHTVDS